MRVALVHDWLVGMRGGEKVLEGLIERFPACEIFTLVHERGRLSETIESRPIHTSFVGRLPAAREHFRKYLPFFPRAIERFDFRGFDVVLSSSHCVAKGACAPEGVPHVCYCHTPMRYIWTSYDDYFGRGRAPVPVRAAMAAVVGYLRRWDVSSAARVDRFVANSENVAARIRSIYGRDADVLRPWVDFERFGPNLSPAKDAPFLLVSALVPYKRAALAIDAFRGMDGRLVIVGDGPERGRLEDGAPPNVAFLGRTDDETLVELYRSARALVFPGEEDFGIVPLEAMASGRPVIAYRAGGALETVVEGATGAFFDEPTPRSLREALTRFDPNAYDPAEIRAHARRFDRASFLEGIGSIVEETARGVRNARDAAVAPATA